jgi:hypothetical protein
MLKIRRWNPWIGCLLAVSAGLVGCAPKTDVSATGNVPSQYSHVYMSVQEIWFNTSATAGPDDTTWSKFPLTTPVTFDLATSVEGTLNSITTGLNVPIGTYTQVRLIPVDASATLLSSASSLGAKYNSEVDYTDSSGTARQVLLELQNPDKGIGVATSVQVKGDTTNVFSSTQSTTGTTTTPSTTIDPVTGLPITTPATTTTPSTSTPSTTTPSTTIDPTTGLPVTTTPTTTPTTLPTTTTSTGTTTAPTFQLAINVDGAKDLVPFTYSAVTGVLLNPHVTAYDQAASGAIQGTLDVTSLTGVSSTSTSSYLNIQVTAESLSADGTRHIAVNSAPVASGGTFTLYPLSTSSSSATSYDLVIHGPGIATIIVKGVTVNVGTPSSTTPVNIGTITPRAATSSFTVTLNTTTPLPAGALVGFYQTLPGGSEVPYLIDEQPIDPFSRTFADAQAVLTANQAVPTASQPISAASIDYGTFTSGSNVTLASADPTEGTSTYRVAGTAPLFTDGALTATVSPTTTTVAVPTLTAASGAALDSTTITISKTTPGKYNKGELIFSHDGAIVATAVLDTILTQTANGTLTISGLPGGINSSTAGQFAAGLYYLSVRTWNTSSPTTTLNREIYPNPVDLRTGSLTTYSLNID